VVKAFKVCVTHDAFLSIFPVQSAHFDAERAWIFIIVQNRKMAAIVPGAVPFGASTAIFPGAQKCVATAAWPCL
jgi:hypothetical protein